MITQKNKRLAFVLAMAIKFFLTGLCFIEDDRSLWMLIAIICATMVYPILHISESSKEYRDGIFIWDSVIYGTALGGIWIINIFYGVTEISPLLHTRPVLILVLYYVSRRFFFRNV